MFLGILEIQVEAKRVQVACHSAESPETSRLPRRGGLWFRIDFQLGTQALGLWLHRGRVCVFSINRMSFLSCPNKKSPTTSGLQSTFKPMISGNSSSNYSQYILDRAMARHRDYLMGPTRVLM